MIVSDLVTPAALTGYVRDVPSPANYLLATILRNRLFNDIEAVWDEVTRTNRAAKFRAWDAETPIGKRNSLSRKRVAMLPISQKTVVGELERLQLEQLRTGGTITDAMVDAIYDDADLNTRAVLARIELARGDVLTDGIVTIEENGLVLEADFGLDPSHLVNAVVVWSDPDAEILSELRAWADTYTDDAGEPPATMVTSRQVVSWMLRNTEIRQLAASLAGVPNLVTRSQLNVTLEAHGLPQIVEYDTRIDVDDVTTRVIEQGKAVFLPSDVESLGFTAFGITAEALELATSENPELSFEDAAGLVGVVMKEGDPVRTWTKVGGTVLPVISDPRKLMVADVDTAAESS